MRNIHARIHTGTCWAIQQSLLPECADTAGENGVGWQRVGYFSAASRQVFSSSSWVRVQRLTRDQLEDTDRSGARWLGQQPGLTSYLKEPTSSERRKVCCGVCSCCVIMCTFFLMYVPFYHYGCVYFILRITDWQIFNFPVNSHILKRVSSKNYYTCLISPNMLWTKSMTSITVSHASHASIHSAACCPSFNWGQ